MSGFENNLVNNLNALIRAAIHSPNYVTGTSGWTINKDGSAEFSNLTIRGTFYGLDFILNSQGLFFYNGVPALGNLIVSITPNAGTDTYGNAYPQGLMAQALILSNQSSAPLAVANASEFYSSIAGRPRYLSSVGIDAVLERSTINVAQWTQGNSTTPATVSAPIGYLAGEGNQNSEFEIEIDGVAITATSGTAQTLSFGLAVDGSILGGLFTMGAVFLPLSVSVGYTIRGRLTILTSGSSGTCIVTTDGQVSRQGVNAGSSTAPVPTVAVGGTSGGTTKAFDSTSNHTLQIMAYWGGLTAGQILTTYRTKLTRRD
jgi:hypothetical protein